MSLGTWYSLYFEDRKYYQFKYWVATECSTCLDFLNVVFDLFVICIYLGALLLKTENSQADRYFES